MSHVSRIRVVAESLTHAQKTTTTTTAHRKNTLRSYNPPGSRGAFSSRVHAALRMGSVVRGTAAGNRLCRFDFRLVFGYGHRDTVDRHLAGLRGAPVDVLQPGRVPSFLRRLLVLLLFLLVTGGRQELAGHLLRHQLRIDAGLPGRRALSHVAHQALERFRGVPVRAHATIPEIVFEHLGLTLGPTYWTLLVVHFRPRTPQKTNILTRCQMCAVLPTPWLFSCAWFADVVAALYRVRRLGRARTRCCASVSLGGSARVINAQTTISFIPIIDKQFKWQMRFLHSPKITRLFFQIYFAYVFFFLFSGSLHF